LQRGRLSKEKAKEKKESVGRGKIKQGCHQNESKRSRKNTPPVNLSARKGKGEREKVTARLVGWKRKNKREKRDIDKKRSGGKKNGTQKVQGLKKEQNFGFSKNDQVGG